MKKIFLTLTGIALLGLSMTSCNKEEELINGNPVFTAGFESGDKTNLGTDGLTLSWDNSGESILVNDGTTTVTYSATAVTNNNKVATFTSSSADQLQTGDGITYKVCYPATICTLTNSSATVTLPAVQTYDATKKVVNFPMYAEAANGGTNLQFKNLCGVLKLNLTASGKSVRSIIVSDKGEREKISGNFTINYNSGDPQLTASGSNTSSVILDCGASGVDISSAKDFYIYLPPATYDRMVIQINYTDLSSSIRAANANTTFTVVRNHRYNLTLSSSDNSLPIKSTGIFTVAAASGSTPARKVTFSTGNLMYDNGIWRTTEEQYDRIKVFDQNRWTHFGWSKGTTNNYGRNTSTSISTYSGDANSFVDWAGVLAVNTLGWRTLTIDEWNYLLNTRKVGGIRSYTFARINYQDYAGDTRYCNGIIILPDDWTQPSGTSNNLQRDNDSYASISWSDWKIYEASGVAFIPAAGERSGSSITVTASDNSGNAGNGFYWSSTNFSNTQGRRLKFDYSTSCSINTGSVTGNNKRQGYCVRLVHNVTTSK